MPPRVEGSLVVARCDNEEACFVSRRRMSIRPSMAYSTGLQWEMEADFCMQIVFNHIAGAENVAPDALSPGNREATISAMKESGVAATEPLELGWGGVWLEGLL